MKKILTIVLALVMTLSLTVCTAGESMIESEAVQCDSTEEFRYTYDNGIVLLDSENIYISAAWLDYKNSDEGMVLQFYLNFENQTDHDLILGVYPEMEYFSEPMALSLVAGGTMRQCVTGAVYDWNCLIGETADCYKDTYRICVWNGDEFLNQIKFDWYVSEKTPFVDIIDEGELFKDIGTASSEEEKEPEETEQEEIELNVVLADEELFKITARSLRNQALSITLDNKSNRTLSFTSTETDGLINTVNGYHSDVGIYEVVGPGESINTEIPLGGHPEIRIKKVIDVQHGIQVRDVDTYELIANVPLHVQNPDTDYDYSSESFQETVQDPQFSNGVVNLVFFTDEVEFDCCGVEILSAAVITQNDVPYLYLELENSTENNLRFYSKALALNDLYITFGIRSVLVPAGKRSISKSLLDSRLDDSHVAWFGLEEISTCEIIGAVTTEDTNGLMHLSEPLGYEPFTIRIMDEEKTFTCGETREVMNQAGIQLNAVSISDQENGGIEMLFTVVNNSGYDVELGTDMEGMVNGNLNYLSSRASDLLPNGATGLMTISLYADMLEEIGITEAVDVTNLGVQLYAREINTGSTILETYLSIDY